ncbi:beta-1,3-N-acetylglucosaminyltransferase manic fringe-like [Corticium candelabrum]|uniref:beta-1,3-N-acetylglucosaminyltransferase manic fringe-like n=1 Tax=Corticium candelabrum TaxID=121492 RepID=UPI002E3088C2|nr:beta-1,3-N-acetylglucosaminyltransferase manic fringe-like [Corticium candelabrum]
MRYFCKKSRFLFFLFLVLILLLGYTLYFDTTGKSKQASIGGDSSLLRSRKSQRSGHTVATVENHQAVKGHNTEKTQISSKANVGEVPVFITVKTGRTYHQTRIPLLLQTWFNYAANETYFVTDTEDEDISRQSGRHLIVSGCGDGHQRDALCCKMGREFELFYLFGKGKDWFCHVDDDNYLNVPSLVNLLSQFDPNKDVYVGKSSLGRTMSLHWEYKSIPAILTNASRSPFWFATGGAGFCISRHLSQRMQPYVQNGKLVQMCHFTGLPDDCTVGFLSECVLGVPMTPSRLLHSHLEIQRVPVDQLKNHVTFSYGVLGKQETLIPVDGPFSKTEDPTRFKSYHCLLNPQVEWCPR